MGYGTKNFENFIPELWSARLLANLDKTFVFPQCVNRDYEGEIRNFGDTVHINKFGDIAIADYTKAGGVGAPVEPGRGSQVTLVIDQAKYFNFKVEDIEAVQANVALMEKAMQRAAYGIGDIIDRHIAAMVGEAGIQVDSASSVLTKDGAYDLLVDLKVELNKHNVPAAGRFVVVPPEFIGLLEKDDRYTKYADADIMANGVKGRVAGFDVRESNNVLQESDVYSIMAGTDMAISFAGQITKIEAYRPEQSFADACKGLYVFGAKVVEPEALACLKVKFQ